MTRVFQRLVSGGRAPRDSTTPRLALAVFGKHPGWNDYLGPGVDTGLGVETETLAYVKQALHEIGIRGQIDSGAWERLAPEKRFDGYDHTCLWLRAGELVLGRLWSSADGKRRPYPMVLCVEAEGIPPAFLLAKVQPEIERLRDACLQASTAGEVTAAWRVVQDRLAGLLRAPMADAVEPIPSEEARRRFLQDPALGPDRLALLRMLHQLSLTPGVLGASRGSAARSLTNAASAHLRLPLASESGDEALLVWSAFLRCIVPEVVPLLLIRREGAGLLDVILGEPSSDDFFCLQASTLALPLTSEIPYELDAALKSRLQAIEQTFLQAPPPSNPEAPSLAAESAPSDAQPTAGHSDAPAANPAKRRSGWFVVLGVLVLAGAALWVWLDPRLISSLSSSPRDGHQPFTNRLGMELTWVAGEPGGGAFVTRHEITRKQFRALMGRVPEDAAAKSDDQPAVNVSFEDAREFCRRLSQREGQTYALPSNVKPTTGFRCVLQETKLNDNYERAH